MKTRDQILRYIADCDFVDNTDWELVLGYCAEHFGGGKVHKCKKPISTSTFAQFMEWLEYGYGSGDFVGYGNTMGVIGSSTPDITYLVAYLDYEKNVIVKNMELMNVERLRPLQEDEKRAFICMLEKDCLCYHVKHAVMSQLYTFKKFSYVTITENTDKHPRIGMYLESEGYKHHFLALVMGKTIEMDCWITCECTPLRASTTKEKQHYISTIAKAGWTFDARSGIYIKQPKRGTDNKYWYISDRFCVVQDKDNGKEKHTERYEAGNYFLDLGEALAFTERIIEMRKKGV